MPLYPPAGTTLSDATPANVQPGVPDAGVATEASRDDHAHDASWSGVAPSASAPGDAAATGAAQGFNRRDHVHGRESYATIAANLKLDDLAAPDDNTDLNVLTTKHGLAPKLSNVSTEYLSGTGVYSVPAGGSGIPATIVDAKGDIIAATAADTVARLAVGTDTHVLTADAAEATGLKWAVAPGAAGGIPATIFDAKGDIIAASAADTAARLAVGANYTRLVGSSAASTGLAYVGFIGARAYLSTTQTVTANTETTMLFDTDEYDTSAIHDVSSNTGRMTVPAGMDGKWRFLTRIYNGAGSGAAYMYLRVDGTTAVVGSEVDTGQASTGLSLETSATIVLAAGQYVEVRHYGPGTTRGAATGGTSSVFEAEFVGP